MAHLKNKDITSYWRALLHEVVVLKESICLLRDVDGARLACGLHLVGQRDVI